MVYFTLFFFISPHCPHCYTMGFSADSLYVYDSLNVQAVVDSQDVDEITSWGFSFPVIKNVNMKEEWDIEFYPQLIIYFSETTNAYVVAEGKTGVKEVKKNISKAVYLEKLFRETQPNRNLKIKTNRGCESPEK